MENVIEVKDFTVKNGDYTEALKLHNEIMANGTIAAQALYELCRCLKRMRDEKLFVELGYEDFDTYCEQKAKIKQRQAHNYIRAYENLGEKFIKENASIGITKIELLTHVPALERSEFMEQNDIEDMSVAKLKEKIKQLEQDYGAKCEQISLLEAKVQEKKEHPTSSAESQKIAELTAEVEKLRKENENAISPDELKKREKERKAEIKAATEKAVREAVDKERKASAASFDEKFAEKEQEYRNKISGYEKRLADKDASISEAVRRQAELEDKLRNAGRDNSAKFRIYFEQMNDVVEKLFEALEAVDDTEQKKKFSACLAELGRNIIDQVQGE